MTRSTSGKGLMNQVITVYFSYACQKQQDIIINLSPPLGENTRGGSSSELYHFVEQAITIYKTLRRYIN